MDLMSTIIGRKILNNKNYESLLLSTEFETFYHLLPRCKKYHRAAVPNNKCYSLPETSEKLQLLKLVLQIYHITPELILKFEFLMHIFPNHNLTIMFNWIWQFLGYISFVWASTPLLPPVYCAFPTLLASSHNPTNLVFSNLIITILFLNSTATISVHTLH